MDDTRIVTVKCTWESTHDIEVPADTPPITAGDLDTLLEVQDEDVTSATASLIDWEITDG